MDGFLHTFKQLTEHPPWIIEDHIRLSRHNNKSRIDYKLLNLLENQSRVIVLHCSPILATRVFAAAARNGFLDKGYAWFVTENVFSRHPLIVKNYPIGLIAVKANHKLKCESLIRDPLALIEKGAKQFINRHSSAIQFLKNNKSCDIQLNSTEIHLAQEFHRYLKNTSVNGIGGELSFRNDGTRTESSFKLYNLIQRRDRNKKWKYIGTYRNGTFRAVTITWPGETISGPTDKGERTLRVVTNVIEPFVIEQRTNLSHPCTTSVPCLIVKTKNKEMLDDIFQDFEKGIHNKSRPYEVQCCEGLSIVLLDKLSRDLRFRYRLYITADRNYGILDRNKTWNGMVEDLINGAAHMAISAFSITRSRSDVIDFTPPYFYSGFSILVSERKRETPIYAFMEPFDGWVWISIVISATVVAVALSLLEWNSPFGLNPWGRKRKVNYTLGSGLNMVYAILFQHTIKTKSPKAWPSKWLQNFWAGVSIFVYSSYTANLAAFLAGKNSGVTVSGIHDPKLLEPGRHVGILEGTSVEEFTKIVNLPLLRKANRYNSTLPIKEAMALLMNGSIDAYLDDTPVLEYARTTMDAQCKLRLVGDGFGEDAYGIGLPKNSFLMKQLTKKILEYHESGYMEDLKDLYFRRSRCKDLYGYDQLQGKATSMIFAQHAGLYLLLVVGIVFCILLMFLEHATFKWLVPYWRSKPPLSFWKSLRMMFWSQRLYRIITSEELVSPHHSAREMIQVMKDRDFTKLFQKSVKRQEKQARNRKNLFNIVEQLQWKQKRDERLEQQASFQESQESDNSATPVNLSREPCPQDGNDTSENTDENHDDMSKMDQRASQKRKAYRRTSQLINLSPLLTDSDKNTDEDYPPAKSDDELLQSDGDADIIPIIDEPSTDDNLPDENLEQNDTDGITLNLDPQNTAKVDYLHPTHIPSGADGGSVNSSLRWTSENYLPNGMVVLSPTGDVFARHSLPGRNELVRPQTFSNFSRSSFSSNLPLGLKSLPLKENRVKSMVLSNSDITEVPQGRRKSREFERINLDYLSKEELYFMWKTSEREHNKKVKKLLEEKADLERRIATSNPDMDT